MLFNQSGQVVNSSIDGCIQMKSYLSGKERINLPIDPSPGVGIACLLWVLCIVVMALVMVSSCRSNLIRSAARVSSLWLICLYTAVEQHVYTLRVSRRRPSPRIQGSMGNDYQHLIARSFPTLFPLLPPARACDAKAWNSAFVELSWKWT